MRLVQYARKVGNVLRPVLAGQPIPLFLSDAELVAAARPLLDDLYARELADFRSLYEARRKEQRATADLSQAAWAVAHGAIDALLVDMDTSVPGYMDDATGQITLDARDDAENYGIGDAMAMRALATGATVLAVRKEDIPDGSPVAAILRYPM